MAAKGKYAPKDYLWGAHLCSGKRTARRSRVFRGRSLVGGMGGRLPAVFKPLSGVAEGEDFFLALPACAQGIL